LITKAVAKATWPLIPINLFSAFLSHVLKFDEWSKVLVQSLSNVLWLVYEEWKKQSAALPPEAVVPDGATSLGLSRTVTAVKTTPRTRATLTNSSQRRRSASAVLKIVKIAALLGLLLFVGFYGHLCWNAGVDRY
jgi:hypothetical protein